MITVLKKHPITIQTKSIIFDMDGVITNTMPDHFAAWQMVLRNRGIEVSHLDIYRREGQRGITSVEEIFSEYGKVFDRTEALQILKEKEDYFKKTVRNRFIVGTRNFLKHLKKRNFLLAIVTGTSRHELHRILPNDIYHHFKVVVTGDDVKKGKPDPEPYLLALKKLAIAPCDAVVIENAPFGIASAKSAHLRCLAIATSLSKEYLTQADHVFSSIKELRNQIQFSRDLL